MALITLAACSGSPGTTTLAHALAVGWPRRCVLLEADPDGGRLAARCGLPIRPGLVDLAAIVRSDRVESVDLARATQRDGDGVEVVVAHPAADQVGSILGPSAPRLGRALRAIDDLDVLIDVGRLRPASEAVPLLAHSAEIVVLMGTRLEDVAAIVHRRQWLDGIVAGASVGALVTAPGEHSAEEAAKAAGLRLIGVRPGRSARRTSERGRRREASWLRGLINELAAAIGSSPVPLPPAPFAMPSGPPLPGPTAVPGLMP